LLNHYPAWFYPRYEFCKKHFFFHFKKPKSIKGWIQSTPLLAVGAKKMTCRGLRKTMMSSFLSLENVWVDKIESLQFNKNNTSVIMVSKFIYLIPVSVNLFIIESLHQLHVFSNLNLFYFNKQNKRDMSD
jgi:hypothetical protein